MTNMVLHKAETRGHAQHGWLDAHHTFSFANYHDPARMHFGVLRVLNDDIIDGGGGFGMHPHDNMEIITIPIEGELEHKDSMGNVGVIRQNEVQVMSAGTGIHHSEYNKNSDKKINLLQIWIFPNKRNVTPRYDQISFDPKDRVNKLLQIVSPNANEKGLWIHQDAWFHLGNLDKDLSIDYTLKKKGNGIYLFVISGSVFVEDQLLNKRDGIGVWAIDKIKIKAEATSEILIMEVPMQ
ncbi:MAG: pirin family protein [Bacteroidetes bacterium]|nr:pirin family protein [Bacteroidota bacterium]